VDVSIRIVYPLASRSGSGRIVLRTEADWNADVEAVKVDAARTTFDFVVRTDAPFFDFKPCIAGDDGFRWSVGLNYLAVSDAADGREVYPHFFDEEGGSITPAFDVPAGDGQPARTVRVYVPPGYEENTLKRYPVLYMHDGANLFFPDEAFAGTAWDIEQTMDMLDAMSVTDKVIVVGLYAQDRMNEYVKPGYEEYGKILVNAVKPAIDRDFRTLTGAPDTAVMGSSLGGVVSLFLAWQWPNVFGKAACLSSTFGYQDDLRERVRGEARKPIRVYLDSGCPGDNYETTRDMRDELLLRGYTFGRDLLYFAFPGAEHDEASWAARCHLPFQFFFGKSVAAK